MKKRKKAKRRIRKAPLTVFILLLLIITGGALYSFNIIPHLYYTNEDFGINDYISPSDKDGDGIDDQSDILAGVKNYIAEKPKYKNKYYSCGYPDDEYGVCTDVVAQGMLAAGYDLMQLINEDIKKILRITTLKQLISI